MSKRSRSFDVAIIGGGPAGSICALLLARGGAQVILMDRGNPRTSQIELVSGQARRFLEEQLGDSLIEAVGGTEVFQTISLWDTPAPVIWNAIVNPWGMGVAVSRSIFDQGLRRAAGQAGAGVLANTTVASINRTSNGWQLIINTDKCSTKLDAGLLVLATGRARRCLLDRNPIETSPQIALMARLEAKEVSHDFYLEAAQNGWWYALPDPRGGLFSSYCTQEKENFRKRGKSLQSLWIEELKNTRLIFDLLQDPVHVGQVMGRAAGMRCFDTVCGARWVAVGDAAFAPDPLSGKGIEFAVESAMFAARSLCAPAQRPAHKEYDDWTRAYAGQHAQALNFYSSQASPY
jgi:flavin-dependent dehydrogenase